ncbi:MAG: hypothetical protein WC627_01445 [Legionella sp.]
MQNKDETTKITNITSIDMQNAAWKAANFSTVAFVTSATIIAVQNPFKSVLVNLSKSGTFLPPSSGGLLGLGRALYAGTSASASSSLLRTGYVTGTKTIVNPDESRKDDSLMIRSQNSKKINIQTGGLVACMAFGDVFVTNISDSLSQLRKVPGLLPTNFNWKVPHNAAQLLKTGFGARYLGGMVNFTALCFLENEVSKKMPFEDQKVNHFAAGTASGMAAAVISYPFSAFRDHLLVQSKVESGLLYTESAYTTVKTLFNSLLINPTNALKEFGKVAAKQAPLRMCLTGIVFGLVAGVGEAMGSEPLKAVVPEEYQPVSGARSSHGFFSNTDKNAGAAPAIPNDANTVNKTNGPSL